MEDLASKISEMLRNPDILSKLQTVMSGMGKASKSEDFAGEDPPEESAEGNHGANPEMMETLMRIMPALSSMGSEDKYSRFIGSLRPLLSKKKQKKLDDASKILQIIRLLPLLKSQGIL